MPGAGKGYNPNTVDAKRYHDNMKKLYGSDSHEHYFNINGICIHCGIHKGELKDEEEEQGSNTSTQSD